MEPPGRTLIIAGVLIAILGLVLTFAGKVPFLGRLPGDIAVQKGNFRFYFPLATGLVLSLLLTIILNVVIRVWRR